jgi:hypothetical protein
MQDPCGRLPAPDSYAGSAAPSITGFGGHPTRFSRLRASRATSTTPIPGHASVPPEPSDRVPARITYRIDFSCEPTERRGALIPGAHVPLAPTFTERRPQSGARRAGSGGAAAHGAWRSWFTMSVVGWPPPRRDEPPHCESHGYEPSRGTPGARGTSDVIHSKDEPSALHAPLLGHPRRGSLQKAPA